MTTQQQQIRTMVQHDTTLTSEEKALLLEKLKDDKWFDNLMHGTVGASAGYIISKFLGLSKKSQILLTIAGFGVGRYLLENDKKHDKFTKYNDKLKVYEIDKKT